MTSNLLKLPFCEFLAHLNNSWKNFDMKRIQYFIWIKTINYKLWETSIAVVCRKLITSSLKFQGKNDFFWNCTLKNFCCDFCQLSTSGEARGFSDLDGGILVNLKVRPKRQSTGVFATEYFFGLIKGFNYKIWTGINPVVRVGVEH